MNVFTDDGYVLYRAMIERMSNDDLRIAHRRASKCERVRYRKEMLAFRTGNASHAPERPAREKQIQIEIITAVAKSRGVKL